MKGYKHLSYEERTKLAILRKSGVSVANIAKELGRPKNTIYKGVHLKKVGIISEENQKSYISCWGLRY